MSEWVLSYIQNREAADFEKDRRRQLLRNFYGSPMFTFLIISRSLARSHSLPVLAAPPRPRCRFMGFSAGPGGQLFTFGGATLFFPGRTNVAGPAYLPTNEHARQISAVGRAAGAAAGRVFVVISGD